MVSHKIAFLALLVVVLAGPALADPVDWEHPAALEREGVRGHVFLRGYSALVPESWGDDGGDNEPGWGGGVSLAYGISRAVLVTGEFAHHQVDGGPARVKTIRNPYDVVQFSLGMEIAPPTRKLIRPWMGIGVGMYRVDLNGDPITPVRPASFIPTGSGSKFGVNGGAGLYMRLSDRVALVPGAQFHSTLGGTPQPWWTIAQQVRLLSLQLGLSYLLR